MRKRYAYDELSSKQFEDLVILICQKLLGPAVQGFADGPDGGRDARFSGTANCLPSETAPWVGTVIVQAKHTNGIDRALLEADFFSEASESCTLAEEIPRIKALIERGELDCYVLFANRRQTGGANEKIRKYLSERTGLPEDKILIVGIEQIDLWLRTYPEIHDQADLDYIDSPLIVTSEDLAEVVAALADHSEQFAEAIDHPPVERVSYEDKNELNNMSAEYAEALRKRYLKDTGQIRDFLAAPQNSDLLARYEEAVDEFQSKIIAKRKEHHTFDEVMNHLRDTLFARDALLRQTRHSRLTKTVLFYMYWNCDIGRNTADA